MTHASRTSPGTQRALRNRPLVVVATWTMDPRTIDPAARALLGIRTDPVARVYRLAPDVRTIADTHRLLARGGYDIGLHPLRATRPDYLEMTPKRRTRAKTFLQDLFAEAFLTGGCRERGSDHHAERLEMSSIPSTDRHEMRAILLESLSAPILDAEGTSRLAVSMAAIAAMDGTLERPDVCRAPMPWSRGSIWMTTDSGREGFFHTRMRPDMEDLLPHVLRIDPMPTDARPHLRLSPFMVDLRPDNMPDPITTMRAIERLHREPIA